MTLHRTSHALLEFMKKRLFSDSRTTNTLSLNIKLECSVELGPLHIVTRCIGMCQVIVNPRADNIDFDFWLGIT